MPGQPFIALTQRNPNTMPIGFWSSFSFGEKKKSFHSATDHLPLDRKNIHSVFYPRWATSSVDELTAEASGRHLECDVGVHEEHGQAPPRLLLTALSPPPSDLGTVELQRHPTRVSGRTDPTKVPRNSGNIPIRPRTGILRGGGGPLVIGGVHDSRQVGIIEPKEKDALPLWRRCSTRQRARAWVKGRHRSYNL